MKKIFKYNAFTLTEILIVLTILGILTTVLLPVANKAMPDKNLMKLKKADTVLANAIDRLVSSGEYYLEGDLSVMPDGSDVASSTYFCETMANVLSTKSVNCQAKYTGWALTHYNLNPDYSDSTQDGEILTDDKCLQAITKGILPEIITTDGIEFYQTNPGYPFGAKWSGLAIVDDSVPPPLNDVQVKLFTAKVGSSVIDGSFLQIYKPICIDVDGTNKGEDPFAYGIRYDGKITMSRRAREWLEKDVNANDEQN